MTITLNGTTGIDTPAVTNNGAYTGDGISFADGTPSNTLVTTTGGNVGIGTASPSHQLDVANGARAKYVQILNNGYAGSAATTPELYSPAAATLAFAAGGAERMRIDSSGNLLVGKTTASTSTGAGVVLYGQSTISGYGRIDYVKTNSGTNIANEFNYIGTAVGSIQYSNTATSYNTSSDYRLKDITGELTGYKERIMALQPKQGSWKADGSEFRGFLAHEFANQYPSLVNGEKDAVDAEGKPVYQGMQAGGSETIADLVALAQEQQTIITEQALALQDLKARIETLENK